MSAPAPLPELARLPRTWVSIDLPGVRPVDTTYGDFDAAQLPPVPNDLGEDLAWLLREPPIEVPNEDNIHPLDPRPIGPADIEAFTRLIANHIQHLPAAFTRFVTSGDLQQRVRSATDCYVDPGDVVVRTLDGARLIHFLSDSQWCCHWLLYAHPAGEAVLVSGPPIGFSEERLAELGEPPAPAIFDAESTDLSICADSFVEFLWRFWIENSIWFALEVDERELTETERAYLEHYSD